MFLDILDNNKVTKLFQNKTKTDISIFYLFLYLSSAIVENWFELLNPCYLWKEI